VSSSSADRRCILSASLLGADPLRLADAVRAAESGGADAIHLDVMDGHFVPKIAHGVEVVAAVRARTSLLVDVHLEVERPETVVDDYAAAGADQISFHVEATRHAHRCLQQIRARGVRAGVVLNPGTSIAAVEEVLHCADLVCAMTHNPATAGYLPAMAGKVERLARLLHREALDTTIAVDGGVGPGNIGDLVAAGARWLVSGSQIFGGDNGDVQESIRVLRGEAEQALKE
jgi:ribulose-phosphate 3-epimerase